MRILAGFTFVAGPRLVNKISLLNLVFRVKFLADNYSPLWT